MALQKPKFITNLIWDHNPDITELVDIPFEIILETLKRSLEVMTTGLFVYSNYPKIFNSYLFIPPYSIKKRFQIIINLARFHLFLTNQYQTINHQKFFQNLKLKPIYLQTFFHINQIQDTDSNISILQIHNTSKFYINISINIPVKQFLTTYRIPSFSLFFISIW
jgi:hypothetical protein